jgi:hypothetical protein
MDQLAHSYAKGTSATADDPRQAEVVAGGFCWLDGCQLANDTGLGARKTEAERTGGGFVADCGAETGSVYETGISEFKFRVISIE